MSDGPPAAKTGIQRRVITLLLCMGLIPLALTLSLLYLDIRESQQRLIGTSFQTIAEKSANQIDLILDERLNEIRLVTMNPLLVRSVKDANGLYAGQTREEALSALLELDSRWIPAAEEDPLVQMILKSSASAFLDRIRIQSEGQFGELFVSDHLGGVVATTNKTSDFYQGDEGWWRAVVEQGAAIHVGDVEFDESAGVYAVDVTVPIQDETEAVIGALKVVLDMEHLFRTLRQELDIGKAGEVYLVNQAGTAVIHPEHPPMTHRLPEAAARWYARGQRQWAIGHLAGGEEAILSSAPVVSTSRQRAGPFAGLGWTVVLEQPVREAFLPLHRLLRKLMIGGLLLVMGMVGLGLFIARRLVRPIKRLTRGATLLGSGELDRRIQVETGDEIEQLADAFNDMADRLEGSTMEILESEARYRTLAESAGDAIVTSDGQGRITLCNPAAERMFGYAGEEWQNLRVRDLYPVEFYRSIRASLMERLDGEGWREVVDVFTGECLRKDGALFPVELSVAARSTLEGNTYTTIVRDVTERRHLEQTREEMKIAARIQTVILPREIQAAGYDIAATMEPAKQVGGDFYDFHHGRDGRYWFGIGDVTRHGVTPGLIMMMAQTAFSTLLEDSPDLSPGEVITRINSILYRNVAERMREDHYMTLTVLAGNGDGQFTFAGAHVELVVFRRATGTVERIPTTGVWVGVLPEVGDLVEEADLTLDPGDVVLLYTDGITEARDDHDVEYDVDRLSDCLRRHADLPAEEIKARIFADVRAWCVEPHDDMTLLVVKRTGVV